MPARSVAMLMQECSACAKSLVTSSGGVPGAGWIATRHSIDSKPTGTAPAGTPAAAGSASTSSVTASSTPARPETRGETGPTSDAGQA